MFLTFMDNVLKKIISEFIKIILVLWLMYETIGFTIGIQSLENRTISA